MGFVIQRFHSLLRPGRHLGTVRSKLPVHSQQSRWDSLCALHCVAMVLQIAGLIGDPSEVATGRRRTEAKILHKVLNCTEF